MARHKNFWQAKLFSYGRKYDRGEVTSFHIVARADDGSESGRFVDIELTDATARNLVEALTEYLGGNRKGDIDLVDEE